MTPDFNHTHYWKYLPDRDEVLDIAYNFMKELSLQHPQNAERFVRVSDMSKFRSVLNNALHDLLKLAVDDEHWQSYQDKDLSLEIDNPFEVDEDLLLPEFSGKNFKLTPDESFSIKLSLKGYITSMRLHFQLEEFDELYYIKLARITAQ